MIDLSKIALFTDLGAAELEVLSASMHQRTYGRNEVIFRETDPASQMFFILSGCVKIYTNDCQGREFVITHKIGGDFFGELGLLSEGGRSASAQATEITVLSMLSKSRLEATLTRYPVVALNLLRSLAQRLRGTTDDLANVAMVDVQGRVLRTLLTMAVREENRWIIHKRPSQREIASSVGATRVHVARVLKMLDEKGCIRRVGTGYLIYPVVSNAMTSV
jgi:CRP/FNR family transcriptional regulator, cyclic AMP receptor protein